MRLTHLNSDCPVWPQLATVYHLCVLLLIEVLWITLPGIEFYKNMRLNCAHLSVKSTRSTTEGPNKTGSMETTRKKVGTTSYDFFCFVILLQYLGIFGWVDFV